jgi:hypothetical protein
MEVEWDAMEKVEIVQKCLLGELAMVAQAIEIATR